MKILSLVFIFFVDTFFYILSFVFKTKLDENCYHYLSRCRRKFNRVLPHYVFPIRK
jgi:hypothetical protein